MLRRMSPTPDPPNETTLPGLIAYLLNIVSEYSATGKPLPPGEEKMLGDNLGLLADRLQEKGLPTTLPLPDPSVLWVWLQRVQDHLRWREAMVLMWGGRLREHFVRLLLEVLIRRENRETRIEQILDGDVRYRETCIKKILEVLRVPASEILADQTVSILADRFWPYPAAAVDEDDENPAPSNWLADTCWGEIENVYASDVWCEHLYHSYCQGNNDAFDVLDRKWRPILMRYARHVGNDDEVSQDSVQTSLLNVLKTNARYHRRRFIPEEGQKKRNRTARPYGMFSAWMYAIARNACIDGGIPYYAIYVTNGRSLEDCAGSVLLLHDSEEIPLKLEDNNILGLQAALKGLQPQYRWLKTKKKLRRDGELEIKVYGRRRFDLCDNHYRSLIRLDEVRDVAAEELNEELGDVVSGIKRPNQYLPDLEKALLKVREALLHIPRNWDAARVEKRNKVAFLKRVWDVQGQLLAATLDIAGATVTNYENDTVEIVQATLRKFGSGRAELTDDHVDQALYLLALRDPIIPAPPVEPWNPGVPQLHHVLGDFRESLLKVLPLQNLVMFHRRLHLVPIEVLAAALGISHGKVTYYEARGLSTARVAFGQIQVSDDDIDQCLYLIAIGNPIVLAPPVSAWQPSERDFPSSSLSRIREDLLATPAGNLRYQVTIRRRLRQHSECAIAEELRISEDEIPDYEARGVGAVRSSIAKITCRRADGVSLAEVDRALFLLTVQHHGEFPSGVTV